MGLFVQVFLFALMILSPFQSGKWGVIESKFNCPHFQLHNFCIRGMENDEQCMHASPLMLTALLYLLKIRLLLLLTTKLYVRGPEHHDNMLLHLQSFLH